LTHAATEFTDTPLIKPLTENINVPKQSERYPSTSSDIVKNKNDNQLNTSMNNSNIENQNLQSNAAMQTLTNEFESNLSVCMRIMLNDAENFGFPTENYSLFTLSLKNT
jgi:hypothetical protein